MEARKDLKHNYIVNIFDGGFFGFAMGFASFATVLPLFVSSMTSSAVLIGLIPAIHTMGWQLPQLLIAKRMGKARSYKTMTLLLTIQERLPFLGLAVIAWFLPTIGTRAGLVLTFLMLVWQGLGAGITANPWQNLIGRIIPGDLRATFFGMQSAAANLLSAVGAVIAGVILDRAGSPHGFSICFVTAIGLMIFSWVALSLTKEPERCTEDLPEAELTFWANILAILKRDRNFRGFLASRMVSQFASMAAAFYTVYAVRTHGMNEVMAGVMTSVLLITQTAANPILGWAADRWSRKGVLATGAIAMGLSALLAWYSPGLYWFVPVFILSGIGSTAYWTIGMALTLEFGSEADRPTYVGMANTLVTPATIVAPFLGGILADSAGYGSAFLVSAAAGLLTALMLSVYVRDPERS